MLTYLTIFLFFQCCIHFVLRLRASKQQQHFRTTLKFKKGRVAYFLSTWFITRYIYMVFGVPVKSLSLKSFIFLSTMNAKSIKFLGIHILRQQRSRWVGWENVKGFRDPKILWSWVKSFDLLQASIKLFDPNYQQYFSSST